MDTLFKGHFGVLPIIRVLLTDWAMGVKVGQFRNTGFPRFSWILLLPGISAGKSAIVGGKSISIKEAPYQLLMQTREEGGATGMCGAVWIGQRWILTAAHCVEDTRPEQISVYAGITRLREAKTANAMRVARIIADKDFPDTWKDIAVVELAQDITSTLARPIPYATAADVRLGLTDPGKLVIATGWGGTNHEGELADSLQALRTAVADTQRYVISMVPRGTREEAGSCGGDSGGPFVVRDAAGTGWIVAGLSSFITSYCGDPASPSSYTRVSAFNGWIQQQTGMATGGMDARATLQGGFFTAAGRFRLDRARVLELQAIDAAGAILHSSRGAWPAGEHAFPATGSGARFLLLIADGRRETGMIAGTEAGR